MHHLHYYFLQTKSVIPVKVVLQPPSPFLLTCPPLLHSLAPPLSRVELQQNEWKSKRNRQSPPSQAGSGDAADRQSEGGSSRLAEHRPGNFLSQLLPRLISLGSLWPTSPPLPVHTHCGYTTVHHHTTRGDLYYIS